MGRARKDIDWTEKQLKYLREKYMEEYDGEMAARFRLDNPKILTHHVSSKRKSLGLMKSKYAVKSSNESGLFQVSEY